ncbi:MAG: NAD(+) diphosphatase [Labilithrix sp.]|nr:NAD(+) diphosphatase [Labilithrix sp.]
MAFVPSTSTGYEHDRRTWLVVHPKGVVGRLDGDRLVFPTDEEVSALGVATTEAYRLGTLDGTDVVTAPWPDPSRRVPAPFEPHGLRSLAAFLDGDLFGVVGRAMHTCDWLTTSRFCGRCGAATARVDGERCVVCPSCALRVYPRISPAIITLVRKGDLALLASNAKFPGVFYSTLAGFADIGESLEETLVREVKEETGVSVANVRYFGSQPWPFPNSLMIGFTAEWVGGEIAIDPTEISDAKWFAADALPMIPPPLSIARKLIDAWIADVTRR